MADPGVFSRLRVSATRGNGHGSGTVGELKSLELLLCRVHPLVCGVPLPRVIETLRPLPLEPLSSAPGFVCGVSIIRGVPVPVVDAGLLFGGAPARPTRFVTLRTEARADARTVALAVDAVIGVRRLDTTRTGELPPLLTGVGSAALQALGSLDRALLLILESSRLVPEELLAELDTRRQTA
jgi:purine-binding chemotaxis protein CheW